MRFGKITGRSMMLSPYLCELEYIESTGTQCINTGISVSTGDSFKMAVDGAYTGTSTNMQLHGVNGGAYFGVLANGDWTVGGLDTSVQNDMARHYFELSATIGTSKNVSLVLDAFTYTRSRNVDAGNIGLFNLFLATGNIASYSCKFRLYSAKIYVGTTLVRDYVAVLEYDYTVSLYDRVTRTFFRNAGTGEFVAGPRKDGGPVVPYLRFPSSAYVNTGYDIANGDVLEFRFRVTEPILAWSWMIGAGVNNNGLVLRNSGNANAPNKALVYGYGGSASAFMDYWGGAWLTVEMGRIGNYSSAATNKPIVYVNGEKHSYIVTTTNEITSLSRLYLGKSGNTQPFDLQYLKVLNQAGELKHSYTAALNGGTVGVVDENGTFISGSGGVSYAQDFTDTP